MFLKLSWSQQNLSNDILKFWPELLVQKSNFVWREKHPEYKYFIIFFKNCRNNK